MFATRMISCDEVRRALYDTTGFGNTVIAIGAMVGFPSFRLTLDARLALGPVSGSLSHGTTVRVRSLPPPPGVARSEVIAVNGHDSAIGQVGKYAVDGIYSYSDPFSLSRLLNKT